MHVGQHNYEQGRIVSTSIAIGQRSTVGHSAMLRLRVPASAPVSRCSAWKCHLYFRNIASSGWRFLLTVFIVIVIIIFKYLLWFNRTARTVL